MYIYTHTQGYIHIGLYMLKELKSHKPMYIDLCLLHIVLHIVYLFWHKNEHIIN